MNLQYALERAAFSCKIPSFRSVWINKELTHSSLIKATIGRKLCEDCFNQGEQGKLLLAMGRPSTSARGAQVPALRLVISRIHKPFSGTEFAFLSASLTEEEGEKDECSWNILDLVGQNILSSNRRGGGEESPGPDIPGHITWWPGRPGDCLASSPEVICHCVCFCSQEMLSALVKGCSTNAHRSECFKFFFF